MVIICTNHALSSGQSLALSRPQHTGADQEDALQRKSLISILSNFEDQYKVKFDYEKQAIEDKFVEVQKENFKSLEEALDTILPPHQLSFKKYNDHSYLIYPDTKDNTNEKIKKIETQLNYEDSQHSSTYTDREDVKLNYLTQKSLFKMNLEKTISGTVTDENNEGLPGVNILVKNTTTGTVTDIDGNYRLNVPDDANTLVFSSVGYLTQELAIGGRSVINVQMAPDVQALQEVVVIGYGSVKKSDLTGSVSSVSSEGITQVPVTSVDRALQGQAAGVQVNQKSGQPGQDVVIRIRGGNSISGGNDPLYVIDGLPIDGLGSEINPEDIASIEILKDASATAIYGSRGANGVVLITTKRGKQGQVDVNYHGYYGVQKLRKKLDMLNRDEFVAMVNEVAANDGEAPVYTPADIANLPDNDWHDLVYRNAPMQSHQLSVAGGNEMSKIYASLNYLNQEGIIRNSGFDRLSLRLNGDQQISPKMNIGVNISLSRGEIKNSNDGAADGPGAVPFTAIVMPPITPVKDQDGNYTLFTGTPWGGTNPVGSSEMELNKTLTTRIISNLNFRYEIIPDLNFQVNVGVDASNATNDFYRMIGLVSGGPQDGQASKRVSKSSTVVNENFLSYNKSFADIHHIDAVAGFTYQETQSDFLSGRSTGFVTDIFGNNLLQAGSSPTPPQSGLTEYSLVSYLGRVNYSLLDRYLFTFTGRYDGSSKFGANNKYAFFPSGAIAWRLSDEGFMSNTEWVSDLKLRVSYGQSGNQAIAPYQTLARMTTNVPVFGNGQDVGFVLSSFPNQSLQWETTTQLDFGLDLGVFGNRILFTADYYKKNTTDLLYNATLPPSSGFQSSTRNVGEIENKGFEFQLNTRNLTGELIWNSTLNMSFNRSKVVDLGTDGLGNSITRVDGPIAGGNWFPLFLNEAPFQLYGFEIEGIYQTDADAIENGETNKTAGEYKFRDRNSDGVINDEDQTILTNLQPNFIFGFNNEFFYKNFELSFLIVGSVGNDIVNEFNKYYTALNGLWNARKDVWENRWTGSDSGGTFAKASSSADDNITFAPPNSLWVEDGSYLRFRDIKIAYNLPNSLLEPVGISKVNIYLSGQNLITITDYSHYDPEAFWESSGVNGWDRGVYPSFKSFTVGLKASF